MAKNSLEVICKLFKDEMTECFGTDIESITLFGSAAGPDYLPGISDHNFLVVLKESAIDSIDTVSGKVAGWRKKRIAAPLFMTRQYINDSLDSFPIEFLNMQLAYQVVMGEDVLKDLVIEKADLRLQAERELKGYLLTLQQGSFLTEGKAGELQRLMADSLKAVTSLFRALLLLKGDSLPETRLELTARACEVLNLDKTMMDALFELRGPKSKLDKIQLADLLQKYIRALRQLSVTVDGMEV